MIGTSSVVYPAASLPEYAKDSGATVIEFNLEFPTPLTSIADITVAGPVSSVWLNALGLFAVFFFERTPLFRRVKQ